MRKPNLNKEEQAVIDKMNDGHGLRYDKKDRNYKLSCLTTKGESLGCKTSTISLDTAKGLINKMAITVYRSSLDQNESPIGKTGEAIYFVVN